MNEVITPFTFSDLPAPVVAELQAVTSRIKDRLTRQVQDIIETGRDLLEVKSKLQHGQFDRWLAQEFGMTDRTARRFMQAATWAEGKTDMVSDLTPTSIYLLSAKSTPEGVHEQVVERLEKGLPAEPEMIRHLIKDAQIKKQDTKRAKGLRDARKAREKRRSTQEQEEQARKRQRDLELRIVQREAREIAKFLRDRLSAEDFAKFRSAIADYSTYAAFLRVPVDGSMATIFPPKPWAKS